MPVKSIAVVKVKPGKETSFEQVYRNVLKSTKRDRGVMSEKLLRPLSRDGSYVIESEWESVSDFEAWRNNTFQRFSVLATLHPLLDGPPASSYYEIVR